jgi:hypothetical protein
MSPFLRRREDNRDGLKMANPEENERLRLRVEAAKRIVAEETEIEERLFQDRLEELFFGDRTHLDRWKVQHRKLMWAILEWRAAVDAYIDATKISK